MIVREGWMDGGEILYRVGYELSQVDGRKV